uniref:Magnesium and cobalt transport protein n=1 Tax=uncultured bacterium BLR17 TaxID=506517 RepID=C0INK4_9BACT|nr:magnesium and cobalt transport protein [uncultured bacterium BLR17]
MIKNHTAGKGCSYEWLDIVNPQPGELEQVAREHNLHEASVNDCLQPGHLPKYERLKNYTFVILRVYSEDERNNKADNVQEITNKIAIFLSDSFIITIHRNSLPVLDQISTQFLNELECQLPQHVFIEIVMASLHTYDAPGHLLTQSMEHYESQVFLTDRNVSLLKGLYFIKRKINIIRRLLLLTQDIVDKIDAPDKTNAYTRDVRDLLVKQKTLYDVLYENANNLLNIYFSVSSQRTDKTMRVLTIFSVFFMPLTFIVGVYGMNFKFMPELNWQYGYPAAMGLMGVTVIGIFIWFRRNKWL